MVTFLQRILGGFAAACLALVVGALTYVERDGTTVDVHASVGIPQDNADADARFLRRALQGAADELDAEAIARAVAFVATCRSTPSDCDSAPPPGSHRLETEPRRAVVGKVLPEHKSAE